MKIDPKTLENVAFMAYGEERPTTCSLSPATLETIEANMNLLAHKIRGRQVMVIHSPSSTPAALTLAVIMKVMADNVIKVDSQSHYSLDTLKHPDEEQIMALVQKHIRQYTDYYLIFLSSPEHIELILELDQEVSAGELICQELQVEPSGA